MSGWRVCDPVFKRVIIPRNARICWHCRYWERHGKFGTGWCRAGALQITTLGWDCAQFERKREDAK
ncbi:hypothetical protein [Candidatus Magnetaquiglobus chichijimensis]|uniref:hypothetical protein n=1 Tax=Candidatus Magnetaquiglobus chichijimensis TaxID=3141448 RepID=UPI003B975B58